MANPAVWNIGTFRHGVVVELQTTGALTTTGGSGTVTAVITGTPPVASSGGTTPAISITGVAGEVLAGSSPAFTATPALGTDGSASQAPFNFLANSAAAFHTIIGAQATANWTFKLPATAGALGLHDADRWLRQCFVGCSYWLVRGSLGRVGNIFCTYIRRRCSLDQLLLQRHGRDVDYHVRKMPIRQRVEHDHGEPDVRR